MWQSHIPLVVIVPVGMAKLFSSRFVWSHQTLNLFLHLNFSIWGNYFSNYTQPMKGGSDLQDEGSKRNSLNNHKNTFFSLLPWGSFHCYSPGWLCNLVQSWTSSLSGCTKKIKRLKKIIIQSCMHGFLTLFNIIYCLHFMYTLGRGISHKRELSVPLTSLLSCLFHVSPLKGLKEVCNQAAPAEPTWGPCVNPSFSSTVALYTSSSSLGN